MGTNKFITLTEWGPGTGKTKKLISDIEKICTSANKSILEQNNMSVIAISFTNAVVRELKSRSLFSNTIDCLTIHSFAWQVIKKFEQLSIRSLKQLKAELKDKEINSLLYAQQHEPYANFTKKFFNDVLSHYNINTLSEEKEESTCYGLSHEQIIPCFIEIMKHTHVQQFVVKTYPCFFIDEVQDVDIGFLNSIITAFKQTMSHTSLPDFTHIYLYGDRFQDLILERMDSEEPSNSDSDQNRGTDSNGTKREVIQKLTTGDFCHLIEHFAEETRNYRTRGGIVVALNHCFYNSKFKFRTQVPSDCSSASDCIEQYRFIIPTESKRIKGNSKYAEYTLDHGCIQQIREQIDNLIRALSLKLSPAESELIKVITPNVKHVAMIEGFPNIQQFTNRNELRESFLKVIVQPLVEEAQNGTYLSFLQVSNKLLDKYGLVKLRHAIQSHQDTTSNAVPLAKIIKSKKLLTLLDKSTSDRSSDFQELYKLLSKPSESVLVSDVINKLCDHFLFPGKYSGKRELSPVGLLDIIENQRKTAKDHLKNESCHLTEINKFLEFNLGKTRTISVHKAKGLEFPAVIFVNFDIRVTKNLNAKRHYLDYSDGELLRNVNAHGLYPSEKNVSSATEKQWFLSSCILYTGLTRAKQLLTYVVISDSDDNDNCVKFHQSLAEIGVTINRIELGKVASL